VALAIDGSTPAIVTSTSTTVATLSTGSFTPPAGALLLIAWAGNSHIATNPSTPTITDSLGSPLTYTLLDWQSRANSPTVDGQAAMWWAVVGSSAAMTVTTTINVATDNEKQQALQVIVITGQDSVTPIGAHGKSGSTSSSAIAQNYTAAATGGQGFIAVCDWDSLGNFTAGTGCTIPTGGTGTIPTTQISYGIFRRTTADGVNGNTTTLNVNLAGTSTHVSWVYAEVVPAAPPAGIPYNPQRVLLYRDPSETPWIQRDRRDALTVATAANPLPSPLDSAWQAGSRYWHLYGDSSDAAPRTWQSLQRNYTSDPNLLVGLPADPLLVGAGVGGDQWRRYNLPDYADRRLVPQQRERESDPRLLTTAELENELLGGAETGKRYNLPATHVDRRQAGQQRPAPSAIDDVQIVGTGALGAWWGIDDTAAFLYGQRRTNDVGILAPPPTPFDPILAGWLPGWLLDNRAATHTDRREVPQQRPYISDPSFYPTIAPTDPLTLAWGVEGHYWLLYNQPAMYTDRRGVPQQRAYVSDPGLLLTAQLENELLGGADTARHLAVFTDRRQTTSQPRWPDPNLLGPAPTDPLLLAAGVGGDIWRRANAPAYADRREVPQQPPRRVLYFDAGPGSPPLTLSWGAGGDYWHRYQWRRPARSWWQPRPVFTPLGDPCTTVRPSSGTTARPGSGTTTRPFTGTTEDPC
jgi:hypothetical protein